MFHFKTDNSAVKYELKHKGLKLLPLQGATAPTRDTQGVASLALGYVLHWAFSPLLLNPKLQIGIAVL